MFFLFFKVSCVLLRFLVFSVFHFLALFRFRVLRFCVSALSFLRVAFCVFAFSVVAFSRVLCSSFFAFLCFPRFMRSLRSFVLRSAFLFSIAFLFSFSVFCFCVS